MMDVEFDQPTPSGTMQQIIVFTVLVIGGAYLAFSMLRRHWSPDRQAPFLIPVPPAKQPSISQEFRRFILGHSKHAVAARLGPPRAFGGLSGLNGWPHLPSFFHADTWYYTPEQTAQSSVAVTFKDDVVEDVQSLLPITHPSSGKLAA